MASLRRPSRRALTKPRAPTKPRVLTPAAGHWQRVSPRARFPLGRRHRSREPFRPAELTASVRGHTYGSSCDGSRSARSLRVVRHRSPTRTSVPARVDRTVALASEAATADVVQGSPARGVPASATLARRRSRAGAECPAVARSRSPGAVPNVVRSRAADGRHDQRRPYVPPITSESAFVPIGPPAWRSRWRYCWSSSLR